MDEQYNSAFTGQQIDEAINKVQNQAPILAGTAQTLTEAQKAQARENIGAISDTELAEELAKRGQLAPEFANSIEECTDTTKLYVLPDGYIYAYMKRTETIVTPGETVTTPAKAVLYEGYRYSHSGAAFKADSGITSLILPLPIEGVETAVVNFTGITGSTYSGYGGTTNTSFPVQPCASSPWSNSNQTFTAPNGSGSLSGVKFLAIPLTSQDDYSNITITLNGEVVPYVVGQPSEATQESTTTTEGSTEIVEIEGFANTGHAFVPADYEDRIIVLEGAMQVVVENAEAIAENSERIEALENQSVSVDENTVVHNAVGATFPPSQKPAMAGFDGYDIDVYNSMADDIHAYIDEVVSGKATVTKEIMGKDASGQYDIARYIYANREHCAWCRENYPKMYAWQNGSTVIYSVSVSPRIGATMYSTEYIGTAYSTVTAVSATNRSRTVNGLEFVRYGSGDVEPTVIYTDMDDERNGNASITKDGITYNRYPMGDLGANRTKLTPVFIYANEHGVGKTNSLTTMGQGGEPEVCAVIAARFLRDLASGKQSKNPLYEYIRENCMVVIIPVANPYGFHYNLTDDNNTYGGYYNANAVNINRNYDTPGWDVMEPGVGVNRMGAYPGSEIETQYIMNTMVESGAVVAMSLHGTDGYNGYCSHQGQSPDGSDYNRDKLTLIGDFLESNWGMKMRYYDMNSDGTPKVAVNTPDITSKSPSYITQCGAYGGIVEFQEDDPNIAGWNRELKSNIVECAYAQMLNLMAMWLSDYLEA